MIRRRFTRACQKRHICPNVWNIKNVGSGIFVFFHRPTSLYWLLFLFPIGFARILSSSRIFQFEYWIYTLLHKYRVYTVFSFNGTNCLHLFGVNLAKKYLRTLNRANRKPKKTI